jgi:hypothetical protein
MHSDQTLVCQALFKAGIGWLLGYMVELQGQLTACSMKTTCDECKQAGGSHAAVLLKHMPPASTSAVRLQPPHLHARLAAQ